MDEASFRKDLLELLEGGSAHVAASKALERLPAGLRAARVNGSHSPWELLEHLRLAQEDILRYTLDGAWTSPKWPEGYWPAPVESVGDEQWDGSVRRFLDDLRGLGDLVRDTTRDLTAAIPHGEGRTYLREILLAADHNAYHLGQLVELRKQLGAWKG